MLTLKVKNHRTVWQLLVCLFSGSLALAAGGEETVVKTDFKRVLHGGYFFQVTRVESSTYWPNPRDEKGGYRLPGHFVLAVEYRSNDPDLKLGKEKPDKKKFCGSLVLRDGTLVKIGASGTLTETDNKTGEVDRIKCLFGVPEGTRGLKLKIRDYPPIDLGL